MYASSGGNLSLLFNIDLMKPEHFIPNALDETKQELSVYVFMGGQLLKMLMSTLYNTNECSPSDFPIKVTLVVGLNKC